MRISRAVLTCILLFTSLVGCHHKKSVDPTLVLGSPTVPPNQVWLEFRGLVSFIFKTDGSVRSVFLSPAGHIHTPLVAVSTEHLDSSLTSEPDWIATGKGDAGLAVWTFTEASLDRSNVLETTLTYDPADLDLNHPNHKPTRWAPSMGGIFAATQQVDATEVDKAAARGRWDAGELTPIFDSDKHKTEKWNIGNNRKNTPLADGVRLKVTLKDPGLPLKVLLTRGATVEEVLIHAGGSVLVSAYPKQVPKAS